MFYLVILICTVVYCEAAAGHRLVVQDDVRSVFLVHPFCFSATGKIEIKAENIKINNATPDDKSRAGFILMRAKGAYSSNAAEYATQEGGCLLDGSHTGIIKLNSNEASFAMDFAEANAGHYFVLFVNCNEGSAVTFDLDLHMTNNGLYLPAGDEPLPQIYYCISALFVVSGCVFLYAMKKGWESVHRVHMLMASLVFVKAISLFLEGIRLHFMDLFDDGYGWSTAYYVFSFLKGAMLFGILLLIGTGLFILKPFLNAKDKKIIMVVLPLQCMVNVAMVVVEETPPGTLGWLTWRDVLHLLDIICCCAILFPIVWSIRHLREAAHTDGQASRNLGRLKLFREFYIMVVCYIYFTRIVVFLVRATLPCRFSWISSSTSELATLIFFVCVGYQFRPRLLNPYFNIAESEGESLEELREP